MPISVRAFFLVGLVVVGSTLPAAQATLAQSSGAARDGAVARVGLRPGQEARAIRRFDLTLADAVERALERNRQIAVQRISPLVRDMQVATANAAFSPPASSGFGLNQATQPSTSFLDGGGLRGASIVTDQGSYDVGVSQRMRRGGGRFELTWNSNRLESTNSFSNFNPSLAATTSLTYTQPLLRGLRTDSARTQLVVSRIDRAIADIDIEETIVNTLADVRLAYWELVHARAAVDVQQQSLALAEQLVRDNRARVEIGMVGEIEVVQARAEAALRRQSLAEAFRVLRTNELALKLLIVGGRPDELWNAEIDPTDRARTDAIPIDLEAAIRAALDRRTDISRVRRQVDINDAMVENLRNSTLPALDLIGSYQLTGQGGPRLLPSGTAFEVILGGGGDVIPGGYGDAVGDILGADYPFWSVQIQMTYPLGRSADEAAYERARLELRQNEAQLQWIELRIAGEVTNAALQVEAFQESIQAAAAARELAEEQLRAEEIRFEVGLSTNYLVVQMQRELAAAQELELRAILDYQRAAIEFDRAQRASRASNGVTSSRCSRARCIRPSTAWRRKTGSPASGPRPRPAGRRSSTR